MASILDRERRQARSRFTRDRRWLQRHGEQPQGERRGPRDASGHDHDGKPCYVTLDELIEAHCDRSQSNEAQDRRRFVRDCYETHRGVRIVDSYFGKQFTGGAILTNDCQINVRYPPALIATLPPAFEQALWRCIALSRRTRVQLRATRRAVISRPLFSVMVYLLGVLDAQAGTMEHEEREPVGAVAAGRQGDPSERSERAQFAIRTATAQLQELEAHLEKSALDQARQRYLWGMVLGVPVLFALTAAIFVGAGVFGVRVDLQLLLGMIAFGALGAALSVMSRLTSAMHGNRTDFTIDHESSRNLVVAAGAFRPIVGALFAVALFVLIESELVPIELTAASEVTRWYAYWGLAFLAGFTERFAQDAVSTAKPLAVSRQLQPGDLAEPADEHRAGEMTTRRG